MKKLLLLAVFTVVGFASTQAQEVKFGVKAGVNFATIVGDDVEEADMKTGLHIGGFAEIMLSERFSLQPELLYSMKGAKSEYSETVTVMGQTYTAEEKETLKLNYISLPIMAKFYISDAFTVHAGPQIGLLVSAEGEYEQTYTENGVTETMSATADVKDQLSSLDFGLALGLGYQLDMGLFFDARYNLGLSNINDDEFNDSDVKNGVIQVSVGYKF